MFKKNSIHPRAKIILYLLRNTLACVCVLLVAIPWAIIALFSVKGLGMVLEKTGKMMQELDLFDNLDDN